MCGCRTEYSATWGHTSVVGNMQYSEKSTAFAVNQGGTANKKVIIRPWQMVYFCQGFLFIKEKKKNEI